MPFRLPNRLLVATAALLSATACAPTAEFATAPSAAVQLARGSSAPPAATAQVAGSWTAPVRSTAPLVDSTAWSLYLTQKDTKLEGSLTRISYINNGTTSVGVSAIRKGSIAGTGVSLEFDRGEGAETPTTFFGTVSEDGRSLTGFHSRFADAVTLVRR